MIAHLRGTLVTRGATKDGAHVVVDVHGVGYLVHVPPGTASRVGAVGETVELQTSLQVREDSMTLYGFASGEARDLFELLTSASGVGPKLGLAALSSLNPDALVRAIDEEDIDTLTVVPGIGKKLAQRLVLELRDKVGVTPEPATVATNGGSSRPSPISEVRLALLELGYSAAESQRAVEPLDPEGDVPDLLRTALRSLAGGGS